MGPAVRRDGARDDRGYGVLYTDLAFDDLGIGLCGAVDREVRAQPQGRRLTRAMLAERNRQGYSAILEGMSTSQGTLLAPPRSPARTSLRTSVVGPSRMAGRIQRFTY
jgi:hypothetical protein